MRIYSPLSDEAAASSARTTVVASTKRPTDRPNDRPTDRSTDGPNERASEHPLRRFSLLAILRRNQRENHHPTQQPPGLLLFSHPLPTLLFARNPSSSRHPLPLLPWHASIRTSIYLSRCTGCPSEKRSAFPSTHLRAYASATSSTCLSRLHLYTRIKRLSF